MQIFTKLVQHAEFLGIIFIVDVGTTDAKNLGILTNCICDL